MKSYLFPFILWVVCFQYVSAKELLLLEGKVKVELPLQVIHGRINQLENGEHTDIEINYSKNDMVRGGIIVQNASHKDITSYKRDLQLEFSRTMHVSPEKILDVDNETSLFFWRQKGNEGAIAVLYCGINEDLEFQLFFICTHQTKNSQNEIADIINQIASSLVISSKSYQFPILKMQNDLVILNPDIVFHTLEPSSEEKKGAELSPQNSIVVKNTTAPFLKKQEESSSWLLIVAGIVLAVLAGAGVFWLCRKSS